MALDGICLNFIKKEIESTARGARVEKVFQPSKEEIVLQLRGRAGVWKLLLCVRANSPRLHFTRYAPENPQKPPMLCMLLRKHLTGCTLNALRQVGLDRILFLDFTGTNEIGDPVRLSLCVEIMARHSNIILLNEESVILDSLKRVDSTKSSVREVLPGLPYRLPPAQEKLDLQTAEIDTVVSRLQSESGSTALSGVFLHTLQGVSPIVCRELAFRCCAEDLRIDQVSGAQWDGLPAILSALKGLLFSDAAPTMVLDETEKPFDFSFFPVRQYGSHVTVRQYPDFSALLDDFYSERDRIDRTRHRAQDLFRLLTNATDRTAKKLNLQRAELAQCADRELLRIRAELINANQYRLEKGAAFYEVENYYEDNDPVRIPVDPALTPAKNAQKYYKEYRKAQTAEQMLIQLIAQGEQELAYLETVLDELSRSDMERELTEIRAELAENGYGKRKTGRKEKAPKALPPLSFRSDDGFLILVGRNNVQNDRLSLKQAANSDLWLHAKNMPGSHVIVVLEGQEIPDRTLEQAASLAAYYSKGRESAQVPVDYTQVRNLKKPQGAKPGFVIYHTNRTCAARPDRELAERLAAQDKSN